MTKLIFVTRAVILISITIFCLAGCNKPNSEPRLHAKTKNKGSTTEESSTKLSSDTTTEKTVPQPSKNEIVTAIKQFVYANSENVRISSVSEIQIARDKKGQWWVSAVAIPEKSVNVDNADIFIAKDGKKWRLIYIGTGIDPVNLDLPEEVRGSLRK